MSEEVESNMKKTALATSILATTLLAAGAVQAQGFGGSYAAVFLGDNTSGSSGALSYGGIMGHNIDLGSAVVGGIEEELSFDPKSGWGSGTAVSGTVSARAGYDLGQALVFGKLGAGYSSVNTGYWVLGGGRRICVFGACLPARRGRQSRPFQGGPEHRKRDQAGPGLEILARQRSVTKIPT